MYLSGTSCISRRASRVYLGCISQVDTLHRALVPADLYEAVVRRVPGVRIGVTATEDDVIMAGFYLVGGGGFGSYAALARQSIAALDALGVSTYLASGRRHGCIVYPRCMESLVVSGVRFDTWTAQLLSPMLPLPPSVSCAPSSTCPDTVCDACAARGETTCREQADTWTVPVCACESNGAFAYCNPIGSGGLITGFVG